MPTREEFELSGTHRNKSALEERHERVIVTLSAVSPTRPAMRLVSTACPLMAACHLCTGTALLPYTRPVPAARADKQQPQAETFVPKVADKWVRMQTSDDGLPYLRRFLEPALLGD